MTRCISPLVLLFGLASCGSPTPSQVQDDTCPQTYEFGNCGCARMVVLPGSLPANAPTSYRWKISAEGQGMLQTFQDGIDPMPEEVSLQLTLQMPLSSGEDTVAVTVVAQARDDSGPIVVGVALPLVAIDSVLHTVRFVPVGDRPHVDTVRLSMTGVAVQ